MYSVVMLDDKEIQKTKGVNKNVENIRLKEYVDVLFGKK